MTEKVRREEALYNLEGGQRHLVLRGGEVKAVAPGLRLVEATEEERLLAQIPPRRREPPEYGLPV